MMVSVRWVAPVLLLAVAATALAQSEPSRPPRDLHRVGDHWTPYNPPDPATYPPGARTHTIVSGDTLWDLAQTYYGNAYLWPQLWESNTWITDAHWIYPGDVLLVEGEASVAEAPATPLDRVVPRETDVDQADFTPVARLDLESRPVPLGSQFDIYCYGYIGHPDEPMPNMIASLEDYEVKYLPHSDPQVAGSAAQGDLIYVDGGADTGLVAGDTYLAVEPQELVHHPHTGELLGRQYDYVGQVRILCTENGRSRAIVTESCREIEVGARLKPIPQLPIPIVRVPLTKDWCDPATGRPIGYIVESREWELGAIQGTLVQIDLGTDHQIEPGDFLTVFRPSPIVNQPPSIIGQIGVLTTQTRTATAVVIESKREIYIGDIVEVR